MLCRQMISLLALASLLLLYSVVAQETGSSREETQQQQGVLNAVDDIIQEQHQSVDGDNDEDSPMRPGKWGTGGTLGDNSEDMDGLAGASSETASTDNLANTIDEGEPRAAPQKAAETNAKPDPDDAKNDTATKRHWGQKPTKETEDSLDSTAHTATSSAHGSRHIPIISKHRDGDSTNAFPEGFTLSARVFTDSDGLAHFDNDEDISLPYVYCGADGSSTAALAVHTAIFREAIAAPTVWNTGDMRPTLAVALRSFRMTLDSGEQQVFQPGDVVLLEDTIRPGHQMTVSGHRDLVVMFVTLQRKHHDVGRANLSIKRASLKQRSCEDGKTNATTDIAARLQSLEWDYGRTRTVILGIVSLSLSTLAADFLAKTAPLWLAVGIGGSVFVAGATCGLTMFMETVLTKLHLRSVRRSLDVPKSEKSNNPK